MSESVNQPAAPAGDPAAAPAAAEKLRKLLARAEAGDTRVVPKLRRFLDENPHVWRQFGDLARHALAAWVRLAGGNNLLLTEALMRHVEALRQELAGPNPTPLEKLLVERVAAGWLQLAWADAFVAQAHEPSVKAAGFAMKRQAAAQQRYLAAIKALADLRRLLPAATGTSASGPRASRPTPQVAEPAPASMGPFRNRVSHLLQPVGAGLDG